MNPKKAKVTLCGEDKAALPIRGEDVAEGLNLEFFMTIPGSRDIEGRQVIDSLMICFIFVVGGVQSPR